MKENFEIESLLLPVPEGIATMVDLIVMTSSLSDFSMEAHPPPGGFKWVNYPDSFYASLQQVSFAAHGAFLKAHMSMDKILLLAKRMSDNVESINAIFESGEEQDIVHLIPEDLTSIKEATAKCSQLSKEVVEKFKEVMELTEEVDFATTALKGRKGKRNTEAEENLNLLKLEKEDRKEDAYKRKTEAMGEILKILKKIFSYARDIIFNIFKNPDLVSNDLSNLFKAVQVSSFCNIFSLFLLRVWAVIIYMISLQCDCFNSACLIILLFVKIRIYSLHSEQKTTKVVSGDRKSKKRK